MTPFAYDAASIWLINATNLNTRHYYGTEFYVCIRRLKHCMFLHVRYILKKLEIITLYLIIICYHASFNRQTRFLITNACTVSGLRLYFLSYLILLHLCRKLQICIVSKYSYIKSNSFKGNIKESPNKKGGMRQSIWLRHYATDLRFVGSYPDELIGFQLT